MTIKEMYESRNYAALAKKVREAGLEGVPAEELIFCGDALFHEGYRSDALGFYRVAKERGQRFHEGTLRRFASLLSDAGSMEEVVALLRDAESLDFETRKLYYAALKAQGAEDGLLAEVLDELLATSYEEELLYDRAMIYYRKGEQGRGKRLCRQIITYYGDSPWAERARLLMEDPKRIQEALQIPQEKSKPVSGPRDDVPAAPSPVPGSRDDVPVAPSSVPGSRDDVPTAPSPDTGHRAAVPADSDSVQRAVPEKEKETEYPPIIEEAFRGLVGMESVKRELLGFYNVIRLQKMREKTLGVVDESVRSYNFVLYGNPGTGKTTVARIIAKVLYALGIRESDKFREADRGSLVGQYVGETAQKTRKVIDSAAGGTLFIDEAYALLDKSGGKDYGREAVDTLLKDMEDNRASYSVIMAGYREPMREMLRMNPGFQSRFNYHIDIPDYSDEELLQIARNIAAAKHYTIDKDGERAILKCIAQERIDETFGNARYIRELISRAEINMANRLASAGRVSADEMTRLTSGDFLPGEKRELTEEELVGELHSLTGLASVKREVEGLMAVIKVRKEAERRGLPVGRDMGTLHMAFRGNPGTGKTTVARLLGGILGRLGMLKRGDVFVECSRAELVGQYQGHTAIKVKDMVSKAMGGVLFIDEAYSLVKGQDDSFGVEAVNTLIAEMENHKNDFVVILAGYTKELDDFLATNPGFASRININLTFDDYSMDEMVDIFWGLAKKGGITVDGSLRPQVRNLIEKFARIPNFGNARGVRNVFELVCRAKDARVASALAGGGEVTNDMLFCVTADDIAAIEEKGDL